MKPEKNHQFLAVILGGANGIGAACCEVMHARGWRVAVADKDLAAAEATARVVGGTAFEVDVTHPESFNQLAKTIERSMGPIEALVVSSGTFQESEPIDQTADDTFDRIISVNLRGTYQANRILAAGMVRRGHGCIVNLSSVTGHASTPLNIYGPSKAAIINMTQSLAGEWGSAGVRVNSVSPGITLVPRIVERRRAGVRYGKGVDDQMALRRLVEPNEVAEAVEFLCLSRASAITGVDLVVLWLADGGAVEYLRWASRAAVFGGMISDESSTELPITLRVERLIAMLQIRSVAYAMIAASLY